MDTLITDSETGEAIGASWFRTRRQVSFDSAGLRDRFRSYQDDFSDDSSIMITQTTEAGDYDVVLVFGPLNPGQYYAYNRETGERFGIAEKNPFIREYVLGTVENVRYTAADGYSIPAIITHPAGKSAADPAPLILMPHGGPQAEDLPLYDSQAQFLASRGYRVLQPNFRGSEGYGRSFTIAGYGEWGGKMNSDILDGARWLFAEGLATPERTCIYGASFGGYSALYAAVKHPEIVRCAISNVGVSDLSLFLSEKKKRFGKQSGIYDYLKKSIGDPAKEQSKIRDHSPITHIASLQIPVLMFHGTEDRRVPVEQSEKFHEAAEKLGKDVRLIRIEDEGHGGWSSKNQILMMEEIASFLSMHIGPGSAGE